jgi:putative sterol carrier protein
VEEFKGPTDIFGMTIYYALSKNIKDFPKYRDFINTLNLNLVLELNYYPLMIKFQKESFEVTREIEKPDAILKLDVQDLLNILDKKAGIMRLILKRRIKIKKGFTKLLKVYKIFSQIVS